MKIDKQVIEQFEKDFRLRDKHNPDLIDNEGNHYKIIKDPHFPTLYWENEYESWTAEQKNNLMRDWWQWCQDNDFNGSFEFENKVYYSTCEIGSNTEGESQVTFRVDDDSLPVFTLHLMASNIGAQ